MCLNRRRFQALAMAPSSGTPMDCRKEWKPIRPSPTERSRMAEYFARAIDCGAVSMKSCSTLSRKRMTSSMKRGSVDHSCHFSALIEDRQQTAVRSLPRWSDPVCSMISEHRLEVETFKPSSRWWAAIWRFTVSEKIR